MSDSQENLDEAIPPSQIIKIYKHQDGRYSIEGNINNKDFCHEMLFQGLQLVNNYHEKKEKKEVASNGHHKHRVLDFVRKFQR